MKERIRMIGMHPGARLRTAAILERASMPEVSRAGFLRSVYIASRAVGARPPTEANISVYLVVISGFTQR